MFTLFSFIPQRAARAIRGWWQAPRLNGWVLVALAVALALHKPWALHTPQLYAEDGSIFLMQAEWHGLGSFIVPYMGYLHTIPRLVAWFASHTLDPAWWPALYNGVAFVVGIAVAARMFSPRLAALPSRPWLALAFFLGPQSGEVLINLTNLQWIVALLLVQQTLVTPPHNLRERVGDLVIIALAGLTGPFVAAFWPVFAWRWWRDRRPDNVAVLILATICAGVQGWFVIRTGPHFEFPPFAPVQFFAIVGQHLLIWPVVGDRLAAHVPAVVAGLMGFLPVVAFLAWTLRPHPRRTVRAPVVFALVFIFAATAYRGRFDTWNLDNLFFGERYFYVPRVLLAWLVVWEFDTVPHVIAWAARAVVLAAALVHLNGYELPAPPNYHWADHCDPVRRGVPANIPTLPEGWTLEYHGRPPSR
jgi:hypothetical protein